VGFDKDHFVGLPIPVSALTVASFTLNYFVPGPGLPPLAATLLPWMVALLGLLMVSKVRYDTLPKVSRRAIKREPWKFIFGLLAVVVVMETGGTAMFPLFLLFIALGLVRWLVTKIRRWSSGSAKFADENAVEPTRIDP
jgi:CDP-diacylglycerol--serine O-phosphatidyltransferase